jgi:hypothetical protein
VLISKDVSNRTSADSVGSGGSSNPSPRRGTPASHTKHIEEQKHHQINPENLTTQYASDPPEYDALVRTIPHLSSHTSAPLSHFPSCHSGWF